MERHLTFTDQKIRCLSGGTRPQNDLQIRSLPRAELPFFVEIKKKIRPKIHRESQGTLNGLNDREGRTALEGSYFLKRMGLALPGGARTEEGAGQSPETSPPVGGDGFFTRGSRPSIGRKEQRFR